MLQAERIIKGVLDGTFTRLTRDGDVKRVQVAADFVPPYAPTFIPAARRKESAKYQLFCEHEDSVILEMTIRNATLREIGERLGRNPGSVDYRRDILRKAGRL